jgi:anti-sigma-K factor RskA
MSTDLHTLSGAYAVNALSPEEADEFRKHLDACTACREEVRELQEAAALMGASEAMVPPAHLKTQVMHAADRMPQLPPKVHRLGTTNALRRTPRLLLAAAAVVMIVAAGFGIWQTQGPDEVVAAPVSQVFQAPDAHKATMQTSSGGTISVATSPALGKMAVDTRDLPDLRAGQIYQLWAVADGTPESAGVLDDPDAGAAMDMPAEGIAVAITIEPVGGSEQPTTEPIMSVVPSDV